MDYFYLVSFNQNLEFSPIQSLSEHYYLSQLLIGYDKYSKVELNCKCKMNSNTTSFCQYLYTWIKVRISCRM